MSTSGRGAADERRGGGPIFSIGHSNQALESFLALLRGRRFGLLVDVRSQPYSRYTPDFNLDLLKRPVEELGMRYLYLGKELGGRPTGAQFYDDEGHVLYGRVAEAPFFLRGIERLEREAAQRRVVVMCSEEDPAGCHRRLLIGRVLARRGLPMAHVRGDGRVEMEEQVEAGQNTGRPQQLTLLGEPTEAPWRSVRSVLPKSERRSSLER